MHKEHGTLSIAAELMHMIIIVHRLQLPHAWPKLDSVNAERCCTCQAGRSSLDRKGIMLISCKTYQYSLLCQSFVGV